MRIAFAADDKNVDVAVECVKAFLEVTAEDPEESPSIDLIRHL
jgi:hypothetical protein